MKKALILILFCTMCQLAHAQLYPERRHVRAGNREYGRENYVEAEGRYMGALSRNQASYEGHFGLGDTYYKQERFEEAEKQFEQLTQVPADPETMAKTFYNYGNSLFQQYKPDYNRQKLEQALEAYKQSLRLNPSDEQAKFNLAYTQKLLERDDDENNGGGGGGGGGGQDNQNPDQQPDQNEGDGDQNPDQQDPNQGDQNGQPQPQEGRMSQQEAEQILNAMQNNEESAREKMEGQPAKAVGRSGKNW